MASAQQLARESAPSRNGVTFIFEIYNASNVRMLQQWYSAAGAGCDGDTSCVVSPAMTASPANGTYHWRIRDYGAYGYGTWTAYNYFTLTP